MQNLSECCPGKKLKHIFLLILMNRLFHSKHDVVHYFTVRLLNRRVGLEYNKSLEHAAKATEFVIFSITRETWRDRRFNSPAVLRNVPSARLFRCREMNDAFVVVISNAIVFLLLNHFALSPRLIWHSPLSQKLDDIWYIWAFMNDARVNLLFHLCRHAWLLDVFVIVDDSHIVWMKALLDLNFILKSIKCCTSRQG